MSLTEALDVLRKVREYACGWVSVLWKCNAVIDVPKVMTTPSWTKTQVEIIGIDTFLQVRVQDEAKQEYHFSLELTDKPR